MNQLSAFQKKYKFLKDVLAVKSSLLVVTGVDFTGDVRGNMKLNTFT